MVPILVGPTGIGKTYLSTLIARKLPVEIISADSRQLYRFLDIGTAKPDKNVLVAIRHHFVDFLRPDEYFSAGQFSRLARMRITEIVKRQRVPLVVGGSGLYVRALVDGLVNIEIRDDKIRRALRKRLLNEGVEKLYAELQKVDPVLAERLELNDKQRILRGLEVYLVTGDRLSELQKQQEQAADIFPLLYGLRTDRKLLYERINQRVEEMLEKGLLAEVVKLKKMGYSPKLNAMRTVGYREIFEYLNENYPYEEMVSRIQQNSRRYAKRQMTWFRRDERINWIDVDSNTDFQNLAEQIIEDYWKHTTNY